MGGISAEKRSEFLHATFEKCDVSETGTLFPEEFHTALSSLTGVGVFVERRNVDRLIKMFDNDGDGSIDFPEFVGMLVSKEGGKLAALIPREALEERRDEPPTSDSDLVVDVQTNLPLTKG
jgi:Ca2+-binding EF-hand superfamily protein